MILSDLYNSIFPKPQWILTDYAERRLEEIGKLGELKSSFEDLSKKTDDAYNNIFQPLKNTTAYILIGAVLIFLLMITLKKNA